LVHDVICYNGRKLLGREHCAGAAWEEARSFGSPLSETPDNHLHGKIHTTSGVMCGIPKEKIPELLLLVLA
jgi:hypothetical protein